MGGGSDSEVDESGTGNSQAHAIGRPRMSAHALLGTLQALVAFLRGHNIRNQPEAIEHVVQVKGRGREGGGGGGSCVVLIRRQKYITKTLISYAILYSLRSY